ncbi:MAG TPA: RidA family protein [Beijerinckiaceae bacterium]|nr:RidA family protein [Beijerinckiaceae bacterium]
MSEVEKRLVDLGVTLPAAAAPIANYVPAVISGSLLVVSGQLCFGPDGTLADRHKGKVGDRVAPDAAIEAARFCAINLLAQAKAALGDLDRITRCVRLGGFINAPSGYGALAPIMNGASDLMVAALGERGRHARSTVGMSALPLDAVVEVEAMFEVRP